MRDDRKAREERRTMMIIIVIVMMGKNVFSPFHFTFLSRPFHLSPTGLYRNANNEVEKRKMKCQVNDQVGLVGAGFYKNDMYCFQFSSNFSLWKGLGLGKKYARYNALLIEDGSWSMNTLYACMHESLCCHFIHSYYYVWMFNNCKNSYPKTRNSLPDAR